MEKRLSLFLLCGCLLAAVAAQSVDTNSAVHPESGTIDNVSAGTVEKTSDERKEPSTESLEVNQPAPVDTPLLRSPSAPADAVDQQQVPLEKPHEQAPSTPVDTTHQETSSAPVDTTQHETSSAPVDTTQQETSSVPVDTTQHQRTPQETSSAPVDTTQHHQETSSAPVDTTEHQQTPSGPYDSSHQQTPSTPADATQHQKTASTPVDTTQYQETSSVPVDTTQHEQIPSGPVDTTQHEQIPSGPVDTAHQQTPYVPVDSTHQKTPSAPLDTTQHQQIPSTPVDTHVKSPVQPRPRPPLRRPVPAVVPHRRPSRPIQYVPSGLLVPDLPFKKDEFRHQVFEFVQSDAEPKQFTADCAASANPYVFQKPGYLIGIWDDKDTFANVDKIKCLRGGDEDEDDDDSDEDDDDVYFELDPNQYEDIELDPKSPNHKAMCPDGFLLTGLTKAVSDFKTAPVVFGHCLKLIRGTVDYNVCEQKSTEAKTGGAFEAYVDWGVECQFGHSAVGVKVDAKRVKSLRCCKVTRSTLFGK